MGSEESPADRNASKDATATGENERTMAEGRDDREPERVFEAPWQARAFAVARATTEGGEHSWAEFQNRLAAEVNTTVVDTEQGERTYYEQWLAALSRLLIDANTLDPEEIAARTRAFAEGDRTAEEWVEGERDHDHGEGHSH